MTQNVDVMSQMPYKHTRYWLLGENSALVKHLMRVSMLAVILSFLSQTINDVLFIH